jgi:hypothetical protein
LIPSPDFASAANCCVSKDVPVPNERNSGDWRIGAAVGSIVYLIAFHRLVIAVACRCFKYNVSELEDFKLSGMVPDLMEFDDVLVRAWINFL